MSTIIPSTSNDATEGTTNPEGGVVSWNSNNYFVRNSLLRDQLVTTLQTVSPPGIDLPSFTSISSADEWDTLHPTSPLVSRDWSPSSSANHNNNVQSTPIQPSPQAADTTSTHSSGAAVLQHLFNTVTPNQSDNQNNNNNNNGPPSVVQAHQGNTGHHSDASVSSSASTTHQTVTSELSKDVLIEAFAKFLQSKTGSERKFKIQDITKFPALKSSSPEAVDLWKLQVVVWMEANDANIGDWTRNAGKTANDNITSAFLKETLLQVEYIPKQHVDSFVRSDLVSDGFAMLNSLLEKLTPSQASEWLQAIDNLITIKMDPDTNIDVFFFKIRKIMSALNTIDMEKFYPLLVISVMDPERFKGVRDSFLANDPRVVDADISELETFMRLEDKSRKMLDERSHPSGQHRPQAQRVTQGGGRPQDSDTNTPPSTVYPPPPPKWKEVTQVMRNNVMCPGCFSRNPTVAQEHATKGCPLFARGGWALIKDDVKCQKIRDEYPNNHNNNRPRGSRASGGAGPPGPPAPPPDATPSATAGGDNAGGPPDNNAEGAATGRRVTASPPQASNPPTPAASYVAAVNNEARSQNAYVDLASESDDDFCFANGEFDEDRGM